MTNRVLWIFGDTAATFIFAEPLQVHVKCFTSATEPELSSFLIISSLPHEVANIVVHFFDKQNQGRWLPFDPTLFGSHELVPRLYKEN